MDPNLNLNGVMTLSDVPCELPLPSVPGYTTVAVADNGAGMLLGQPTANLVAGAVDLLARVDMINVLGVSSNSAASIPPQHMPPLLHHMMLQNPGLFVSGYPTNTPPQNAQQRRTSTGSMCSNHTTANRSAGSTPVMHPVQGNAGVQPTNINPSQHNHHRHSSPHTPTGATPPSTTPVMTQSSRPPQKTSAGGPQQKPPPSHQPQGPPQAQHAPRPPAPSPQFAQMQRPPHHVPQFRAPYPVASHANHQPRPLQGPTHPTHPTSHANMVPNSNAGWQQYPPPTPHMKPPQIPVQPGFAPGPLPLLSAADIESYVHSVQEQNFADGRRASTDMKTKQQKPSNTHQPHPQHAPVRNEATPPPHKTIPHSNPPAPGSGRAPVPQFRPAPMHQLPKADVVVIKPEPGQPTPQKTLKRSASTDSTGKPKKHRSEHGGSGASTPRKRSVVVEDDEDDILYSSKFQFLHQLLEMVEEGGTQALNHRMSAAAMSQIRSQLEAVQADLHHISSEHIRQLVLFLDHAIKDGYNTDLYTARNYGKEYEIVCLGGECASMVLAILTAPNMPTEVYIEEAIEHTFHFTRYHLNRTVLQKTETGAQDVKEEIPGAGPNRRPSMTLPSNHLEVVFHKVCKLIRQFGELFAVESLGGSLGDSLVGQLSNLALGAFFTMAEDVPNKAIKLGGLQLAALELLRSVCNQYIQHRAYIMDAILDAFAKLPTGKRNLRTYTLPCDSKRHIQMVTALILQLLQSFPRAPKRPEKKGATKQAWEEYSSKLKTSLVDSYRSIQKTAQDFLARLVQKCIERVDGDAPYKDLLNNLCEDLYTTLYMPEWPAAELMLNVLKVILYHHLQLTDTESSSRSLSGRTLALDKLGEIAARLKAERDVLSVPVMLKRVRKEQASVDSRIVVRCKCGKGDIGEYLVDCQQCGDWYHPSCVGLPPTFEGEWVCEECESLGDEELQVKEVVCWDEEYFELQTTLSDSLQGQAATDPEFKYILRFLISQWFTDLNTVVETMTSTDAVNIDDQEKLEECGDVLLDLWGQLDTESMQQHTVLERRTASSISKCLGFARKGSLGSSLAVIMRAVLVMSQDENIPTIRCNAIKVLNKIADIDPSILEEDDVQTAVEQRLKDPGISVREAAVGFIGKFMHTNPEYMAKYYPMIMDRMQDTGKSVRKTVIKELSKVCLEQPDNPNINEICIRMLKRINDPAQSIQGLVQRTFQDVWFSPPGRQAGSAQAVIMRRAMMVVQVVYEISEANGSFEWLDSFLSNMLNSQSDGATSRLQVCRLLVTALKELLLKGFEDADAPADGSGAQGWQQPQHVLMTMHLMAKACPSLLADHLETLQPYLLLDRSQGALVHYAVQIIDVSTPSISRPNEEFFVKVEGNLQKILKSAYEEKKGVSAKDVLLSAAKCLCTVVDHATKRTETLTKELNDFSTYVRKLLEHVKKTAKMVDNPKFVNDLTRCLYIMCVLCRYHDFDSKPGDGGEEEETKDEAAAVKVGPITTDVFDLCLYFASTPSKVSQNALQALGFLISRHHALLLQEKSKTLYMSLLADDYPDLKAKQQVLKNLQMMLADEEERLRKLNENKTESAVVDIKGRCMDHELGQSSAVMNIFLHRVLAAAFHPVIAVRSAALMVLSLTNNQGLVHPIQCIPCLVALEADPVATIRDKAYQQLKHLYSTRKDFVMNKAVDGVTEAYSLLLKLSSAPRSEENQKLSGQPVSLLGYRAKPQEAPTAVFSRVYALIGSSNPRASRRSFLSGMLAIFKLDKDMSDAGLLAFLAENMAYLPYTLEEEPLYVIYTIEEILSTQCTHLEREFRQALGFQDTYAPCEQGQSVSSAPPSVDGQPTPSEISETTNTEEDMITNELPGEDEIRRRLNSNNVSPFVGLCRRAKSLTILYRLQRYLREAYALADEIVSEYTPWQTNKDNERPVMQNKREKELLFALRQQVACNAPFTLDVDSAIAHALEFKLMMEEHTTASSMTVRSKKSVRAMARAAALDSDDENPAPKKRGRKRGPPKKPAAPKGSRKRSQKRMQMMGVEDEEENQDEEYDPAAYM